LYWCGRRDLNSRTIIRDGLPGRWVGGPMDAPGYVLDQTRLRPHKPIAIFSGFIYLTILRRTTGPTDNNGE
jgi:hypothetical protein